MAVLAQLLWLNYFGSKSEYTMAPKMRGGIRQRHDRRIREALAAGRPEEEAGEGGLGQALPGRKGARERKRSQPKTTGTASQNNIY